MKIRNVHSKIDIFFVLSLIIYIIIGILLLPLYQYEVYSDGISYISIANKYAGGDFTNAINGYWSPLISWLMVPFIFGGLRPVLAFHILNLAIGLLTLIGIRLLFERFTVSQLLKRIGFFLFVPIMLYFSLPLFSPDLLLTCVLVYYLYKLSDPDYTKHVYNAIAVGILGGVAYLCKAYAFPFFVVHFSLVNIALHHYSKNSKKKKILVNLFVGLLFFSIISGPWVYLISAKYSTLTFGTSGRFNLDPGSDFSWSSFRVPPNETALHGWEDPSYYVVERLRISPVSRLKGTYFRMLKTINILESFSTFSIAILFVYFLFLVSRSRNKNAGEKLSLLFPLITVLIYCGGYCLVHTTTRYLWIVYILLVLMGSTIVNKVIETYKIGKASNILLLAIFFCSFLILPRWELDGDRLRESNNKYLFDLSRELAEYNIAGNVASNKNWLKTLNLVYYMSKNASLKYFGVPKNENELKDYDIDYFVLWKDEEYQKSEALKETSMVKKYEDSNLAIYQIHLQE